MWRFIGNAKGMQKQLLQKHVVSSSRKLMNKVTGAPTHARKREFLL